MTIAEAVKYLESHGVEDARYSARELFLEIGGVSRSDLLLGRSACDSEELISAIRRRGEREPLQYIIGWTDFYRERYRVSEDCLIPRSDTELLVDIAVRSIPSGERFADLCCGSGCVGISTLKNTRETKAVMVDISPAAVELARRNAEENGVVDRAELAVMDVLSELPSGELFAVLSNPPYVTEAEYGALSVLK